MKNRVIILGSTGSIGRAGLEVLGGLGPEARVVGLAAQSSWRVLAEQARYWRPEAVAISDAEHAGDLREALSAETSLTSGETAMVELVDSVPCDCVLAAVVGAAGLQAVLRAVELGRRVAIANKEALVMAGSVLMPLARKTGAQIIPVDSEHSGVFQAMHSGAEGEIRTVYLTASGGPFRTWNTEQMANATLEQALNHPTWDMGPKITIDSATMMNKALEIIEARWLFDLDPDRIKVLVHPESIVHALVEFADGSVVAQMGTPDMRTPIQYALTYPKRMNCCSPRLDLGKLGQLNFEPPDELRFPALRLAHQVAREGGVAGAVLNAANESAVKLFREGEIRFTEIVELTAQVLGRHETNNRPTLNDLLDVDQWARNEVTKCSTC